MKIVILSGAGLSAESGLGTFRDTDGLWTQYDLSEVATPEGFARNPDLVHSFYNARRANCIEAEPNQAHVALAELSRRDGVTLITQNVDDLLERAGAQDVLHMHGQLMQGLCAACGHRWSAPKEMQTSDPCPQCQYPATRPDVVWFGEVPYGLDFCSDRLAEADIFAAIGTSGEVYPAAGFVDLARAAGAHTVEINLEPTSTRFDEVITGPASETVPDWISRL